MGLSETILAAMIGAGATVGTALFQLLMAFRARGKIDSKPKKGSTLRSVLAVMALMAASAAGGFLYSQLLREREQDDLRAMRQELRELRDLTAARMLAKEEMRPPAEQQQHASSDAAIVLPTSLEATRGEAESIVYVPACRSIANAGAGECGETDAQRIALCGTVPAAARIGTIKLFAQPDAAQQPWDEHSASLEADLGGARFTGKTFEYAQVQGTKAVCVNFQQWSSTHPHIARIVVEYELGDADSDSPSSPPMISAAPLMTPASISVDVQSVNSSSFGAAVR